MTRVTLLVVLTVVVLVVAPASIAAGAGEKATLHVRFTPYTLGAGTTVIMGFRIGARGGAVPAPLTHVAFVLPGSLGFANTLGLDTCDINTLMAVGPGGCPSDAQMGRGLSVVEVAIGPVVIQELTYVTVLMAASTGTHTKLLVYAEGRTPVAASVIFPGELVSGEAGGHFTTAIEATLPIIPSLPESPDVSVLSFEASIGPEHLTYYRTVHGQREAYQPRGLSLPRVCPSEAFPFSAQLGFIDGVKANATATIQCPSRNQAAARIGHRPGGGRRAARKSDCRRGARACATFGPAHGRRLAMARRLLSGPGYARHGGQQ